MKKTNNKNKKNRRLISQIIGFSSIAILCGGLIVGNIYYAKYEPMIGEAFFGSGTKFEGEDVQNALAKSDELAQKIESEGIVMVKNTNSEAPLKDKKKVNLFGWTSSPDGWIRNSDGSNASAIAKDKRKTLVDGLSEEGIEYNEELINYYTSFRRKRSGIRALNGNEKFFMLIDPQASVYTDASLGKDGKSMLDNAKAYSDTAVVVIGRLGGEGTDLPFSQYLNDTGKYEANGDMPQDTSRNYLQISKPEEDMLNLVKQNFDNVCVIINSCNAMQMDFLDDPKITSAYLVGGTGQSGALQVAKVLDGKVNPSGRTVDTYVWNNTLDPSYANAAKKAAINGSITYAEDIYMGYKWWETASATDYYDNYDGHGGKKGYDGVVQYPFGYGLSYTTFKWELAGVDKDGKPLSEAILPAPGSSLEKDGKIEVNVKVTNTGTVAGQDVVQLYYSAPYYDGQIEKSALNLAAFAKTTVLEPQKSEYLKLSFNVSDMASYDCYDKNFNRNYGYELDKGNYTITLRHDAHTVADFSQATINYKIDKPFLYTKDPVTNNRVTNRFTAYDEITMVDGKQTTNHVDAYGGASIDGSDKDGDKFVYLSRKDFKSTFPTQTYGKPTSDKITKASDYVTDKVNTDQMPTFSTVTADKELLLVTGENGRKLSIEELNGAGTNLKVNDELVQKLGKNYDDPAWNDLLNQMSKDEINTLLDKGGYHTEAVASIGKVRSLENDGPTGLNRTNQGVAMSDEELAKMKQGWTSFPMSTVLAQTWNTKLAYQFGLSVANEGTKTGVYGWYAPGANMHRSPFDGRNTEYYSEDPYLSGQMSAWTIKGAINNGMNVYMKHFAVNETETKRGGLYTWLTEQNLRENYLKPFEIAVKEGGANGMMSAFNRVGASWAGSNYSLMTEVLRNEWGFRGAVITDWSTGGKSGMMAMSRGIPAGNDIWLNPADYMNGIDLNNPTMMTAARKSAKNVIYAWCNSYYKAKNYKPSEDEEMFKANVGSLVVAKAPFNWMTVVLIAIDVVVLLACAVWAFFLLKKKKENPKPVEVKVGVSKDQVIETSKQSKLK